ncbi:MAG: hypothetical protein WCK76_00600 [Elusimicrobiota bacterium]|nr:hypothetical protein [Elusimicrobiota bacterium]
MTLINAAENKEFKMWMSVSLGLIKDGKMGATKARAERIKTALTYTSKLIN